MPPLMRYIPPVMWLFDALAQVLSSAQKFCMIGMPETEKEGRQVDSVHLTTGIHTDIRTHRHTDILYTGIQTYCTQAYRHTVHRHTDRHSKIFCDDKEEILAESIRTAISVSTWICWTVRVHINLQCNPTPLLMTWPIQGLRWPR